MIQNLAGQPQVRVNRLFVSPKGRALHVGLTGGIGSGKSTVAKIWARMGATVVTADELAREVVEAGTSGLAELVRRFGSGVLSPEGKLDRERLSELIFVDSLALEDVENIMHPLIADAKEKVFSALGVHEVGVYDVPLLVEKRMENQFDVVVVVEAPPEIRLDRLEARGLPSSQAKERMAVQAKDVERGRVAHIVIDNAGNFEQLCDAADLVGRDYLGLRGDGC